MRTWPIRHSEQALATSPRVAETMQEREKNNAQAILLRSYCETALTLESQGPKLTYG